MSDQLRGNARATLARLNSLGVGESMILTGMPRPPLTMSRLSLASPRCVPNACPRKRWPPSSRRSSGRC